MVFRTSDSISDEAGTNVVVQCSGDDCEETARKLGDCIRNESRRRRSCGKPPIRYYISCIEV